MKKFFAIFSLAALSLASCATDEPTGEKGKGSVAFNCAVETIVDDTTRANISCTTPAAADFALLIEGVDRNYSANYATIAEFNEGKDANYLYKGEYKATVTAGDIAEEGYDKATFVGVKDFSVAARQHTNVEITAYIANSLVKVEVTDAFKTYFPGGHTLTLATAAGNEFDVTEQTEPLFIAPAEFTINGTATKQPNQSGATGTVVTLPEYKLAAPAAQTLYTIKFDVEGVGQATLTITLNDELVESIDIEQELNDNAE